MSSPGLSLGFALPSLGFALALEIAGLTPALAALLAARWPPRLPGASVNGELVLEAVAEPVGLPASELVAVDVRWTGPAAAEVRTNTAALSLRLDGDRLRGEGKVMAAHARGGVEAAVRAAVVLALARRGVLVLHASAVHRDGEALVFLGASTAGKTTTARRLGREGLRRIADDMIAVDLADTPPTLHPLPFERAGRALPAWGDASNQQRLRCRGGALVRKGASSPGLAPLLDAPRVWAEALITLPPPPGAAPPLLATFLRLCALPLLTFDVPPSGPLAPTVLAWLDALQTPRKKLDATPSPSQASSPGPAAGTMTQHADTSDTRRVERAPNVAWRVLDGTAVLIAPSSPAIQTLNPVATLVWQLADGRALADIVDAVVREFEVEPPQARLDVDAFVRDLAAKGLLTVRG